MSNSKFALLGSGGHAVSVLGIMKSINKKIDYIVDISKNCKNPYFSNYQYIEQEIFFEKFIDKDIIVINALGMNKPYDKRYKLQLKMNDNKLKSLSLKHSSVITHFDTHIEDGVQIFAGSIVQNNTVIKSNTIINTKVSIDHDCIVGNNCHLAPGVTVCGGVNISSNSMIGAGSIILPGAKIKSGSLIKAGSIIKK